jgi:hypothetical protein
MESLNIQPYADLLRGVRVSRMMKDEQESDFYFGARLLRFHLIFS